MRDFIQKAFSGLARKIGIVSLMAICFALLSVSTGAQTVLVNYSFNDAVAGNPCNGGTSANAAGVTSTFSASTTCTTPAGVASATNSTPPAFVANTAGTAVSITNFGNGATQFFQFQLNGVSSFQDYMLFAQLRGSGTGATSVTLQYSLNGTSFTDFQTFATTTTFAPYTFDLSSIAAIEGQPTVYFRFLGANTTGATGTTGTFAIDNFQVRATATAPALPDLTISQSGPSSATTGSFYDYTLRVSNNGATDQSVDLDFTLPTGVTFNAASAVNGCMNIDLVSGVVQFRGCTAAANSSNIFFTINVTAPMTAQTITSPGTNAVVDPTSSIAESNETNNTATATVTTTVTVAPTAAGVNVSGRVATGSGNGIGRAKIMLFGGSLTEPVFALTDSDGNYRFSDVPAGETYTLSISAKGYNFNRAIIVVNLNEDVTDAHFIGTSMKQRIRIPIE